MFKQPAIFLDRDGTIIKDCGYLRDPKEVEFFPETFPALHSLQERFALFIITNQSGISKGITTASEVEAVNNHLIQRLKEEGIEIKHLFCCPHTTEDNCACKKPGTLFIEQASEIYNIDPESSYIVGDHPSDVYCGINSGMTPVYVLSGHGSKHRNELEESCVICENISDATGVILNDYHRRFIGDSFLPDNNESHP